MKTKKVNRYYCDFCTKANCSSSAMRLHERHCTMNLNRQCRMCRSSRNLPTLTKLFPATSAYYDKDGKDLQEENLKKICKSCGGCPACILAMLRQSSNTKFFFFDYKEEAQTWFRRYKIST